MKKVGLMSTIAVVFLVAVGGLFYWNSSSRWCDGKTVKEVVSCGDVGCVYSFEDGSQDVKPKGHSKGDLLEVCRDEEPEEK